MCDLMIEAGWEVQIKPTQIGCNQACDGKRECTEHPAPGFQIWTSW
jgi:hypothetical protein